MVVAAAWLGQSQLSITQHYLRATWGGRLEASRKLEAMLTGAPKPGEIASVTRLAG